ncbi:MAG: hypothetical protein ABIA77_07195, partial [Candidatus Omnitrophota bacterium]
SAFFAEIRKRDDFPDNGDVKLLLILTAAVSRVSDKTGRRRMRIDLEPLPENGKEEVLEVNGDLIIRSGRIDLEELRQKYDMQKNQIDIMA